MDEAVVVSNTAPEKLAQAKLLLRGLVATLLIIASYYREVYAEGDVWHEIGCTTCGHAAADMSKVAPPNREGRVRLCFEPVWQWEPCVQQSKSTRRQMVGREERRGHR